jgi:hypothetical protein
VNDRLPRTYLVQGLLLGLLLALLPALPTHANGAPVNVTLSYLQGVSNWGPTNATGVAELVYREGEVRLTTTGLPRLSGEQYRLWLVNTANNDRHPVLRFNTSEDGVVRLNQVLPEAIPDKEWNLLLVAAEADGANPAAPGDRVSIAGRIQVQGAEPPRPGELPRTGGAPPAGGLAGAPGTALSPALLGMAALGLLIAIVAAFGLGRWTARRQPK